MTVSARDVFPIPPGPKRVITWCRSVNVRTWISSDLSSCQLTYSEGREGAFEKTRPCTSRIPSPWVLLGGNSVGGSRKGEPSLVLLTPVMYERHSYDFSLNAPFG